MKSRIAILLLLVAALACPLAKADEEPSPNYQHLKCFDQLVGEWVYVGPAPEAVAGIIDEGDRIHFTVSWKWILNKSAIRTGFTFEVKKPGGFKAEGEGLIGWDAADQRIVSTGMTTMGSYFVAGQTYDADSKTWSEKQNIVSPEGSRVTQTNVFVLKGAGEMIFQAKDRKGGSLEGDSPVYTFKRAK